MNILNRNRILSLLLATAMTVICFPALASEMSVTLVPSTSTTNVQIGTSMAFDVLGENTAAVSMMIVAPDSSNQILEGSHHEVTFSQIGTFVIIGYGANDTDETAPGFTRCMSDYCIINTVAGEMTKEEKPFGAKMDFGKDNDSAANQNESILNNDDLSFVQDKGSHLHRDIIGQTVSKKIRKYSGVRKHQFFEFTGIRFHSKGGTPC